MAVGCLEAFCKVDERAVITNSKVQQHNMGSRSFSGDDMNIWHVAAVNQRRRACCMRSAKDDTSLARSGSGWLQVAKQAGSLRLCKQKRAAHKAQYVQEIEGSMSMEYHCTPPPLSPTAAYNPSSTPPLQYHACASASCDLTSFQPRLCRRWQSETTTTLLASGSCESFDADASLCMRPPLGPSAFECSDSPLLTMPFSSPEHMSPPRPAAPFHDPDCPSYTAVLPCPNIITSPLHAPDLPATPATLNGLAAVIPPHQQQTSRSSDGPTPSIPLLPPNPNACPHAHPPWLPDDAAPADAAYSRRCQKVLRYMRTHSAAAIHSHISTFPSPDSVFADLSRCCLHGLWEELQASLWVGPGQCPHCLEPRHAADLSSTAPDGTPCTAGVPVPASHGSASATDDCCGVAMTRGVLT